MHSNHNGTHIYIIKMLFQIYLITLFLGEIRFINRTICKHLVELTTQSMPCRLESSYISIMTALKRFNCFIS